MTTTALATTDLRKMIETSGVSLNDLLTSLAEREAEQSPAPATPPAAPKSIALSEATRVALRTIPVELSSIKLPGEIRPLTEDEANQLIPLFVGIKDVNKALGTVENAIKETFHGHFDSLATEDDPVDKNGHRITEGWLETDDLDEVIVRGTTGGNATALTEADLAELEADGKIDHATYLALTVSVPATRTVAPDEKIMAVLKKRPELTAALASKATLSAKGTAIRISKKK